MECVMISLFVFGVIILVLILSQVSAQKTAAEWRRAAEELGLRYEHSTIFRPPCIEGRLGESWVSVDTFRQGSGKSSTTYTRYKVDFPQPLGLGLRLSGQGFFAQLWTFLGAQDINTGDEEFDRAVVVKGDDPEAVRRYLTPVRRRWILDLLADFPGCTVEDKRIHWADKGVHSDARRVISTLRRMTSIARELAPREVYEEEEVQVIPVQPVYEAAPASSAEEATVVDYGQSRRRRAVYEESAERKWEEPLHAEHAAVVEANPVAAPAVAPPPPAAEVSAPPPILTAAPQERSDVPPPLPEPPAPEPSETAAPERAPAPEAWSLEVGEVCKELFAAGLMTHRIGERFEERYKGREVCWRGTLRQASASSFDLTFGSEPGVKATFDIYEVPGSVFGTEKVEAVVQFPPEIENELRARLDQPLTFRGKLAGCDPFMRRLLVANGRPQPEGT